MPFIGNQPALAYTSFAKQDFTTSATTSYTLDNPVANANELALFINFVRQEPTTAYSASGTSLTLTSATSASDDMYCVFLGNAVQTVNPPNGSVGSSQVAASIITGQTALASEPADTDEFLVSDAGTLKRIDYSLIKGGGITQADQWRITAGFNTTGGDVTANWERIDTDGPGLIGSGVSESSGIFTFPETGIYLVSAQSYVSATSGAISSQAINIRTTLDNSSYSSTALSYDSSSTTNYNASFFCSTLFDVTDTSTHKVKLAVITGGTSIFDGSTSHTATGMTFIRLGNT